ncbi:MAG: hypothetical protein U0J70_10110, partial [Atopobiaceae bacterium]|nr:hypothetical protein [Atopobiaceae bacterium]
GIRDYTLETQLVLELMRRRIQADGYYLGEDYPTRFADYHLLSAAAYEDVLAGNKALTHELTLDVDGGASVRIDELASMRRSRMTTLASSPILLWDDYSGTLAQRYQKFCLVHAQQVFTIRARFGGSSGLVEKSGVARLCPKEPNDLPQGYRLFPPAFFVLPLSPDDTCLCARNAGFRHWINAAHPLAAFLLHNANALHDRTPGILFEFTRCLAEDDGDDLVRTVNTLVRRLRALHGNPLNVSSDLELKPSDLC